MMRKSAVIAMDLLEIAMVTVASGTLPSQTLVGFMIRKRLLQTRCAVRVKEDVLMQHSGQQIQGVMVVLGMKTTNHNVDTMIRKLSELKKCVACAMGVSLVQ